MSQFMQHSSIARDDHYSTDDIFVTHLSQHIRCTSTPPQDLIEELQEEQERLERDRIKKEKLRVLMAQPRRISSRLEVKQ